jgi:hypothetical protein
MGSVNVFSLCSIVNFSLIPLDYGADAEWVYFFPVNLDPPLISAVALSQRHVTTSWQISGAIKLPGVPESV